LLVGATKRAGDSTLQRIVRMVEEAQGSKAPAEQFVDRSSRVYTPLVVAVAVTVAAVPPLLGAEFGTWLYRALALLIIACPCSLVISTPVTVVSGIGAASRRGILVKGGAALEAAGLLKALLFDKTGTLTEGRPVVACIVALGEFDEAEAVRLAAALERRSEHPLAHGIVTAAEGRELPPVAGFRTAAGRGAEGEVGGPALPSRQPEALRRWGRTPRRRKGGARGGRRSRRDAGDPRRRAGAAGRLRSCRQRAPGPTPQG